MGLNKAIEPAMMQLKSNNIMLKLTQHEWRKVSEALRSLLRSKQAEMTKMPTDDFRRKSFGYDIYLINTILDKVRKQRKDYDNK